ncbi:MAG: hypothetical protein M1822_003178 [Bathelium mastoideum]|nr:MAG: hypothetical protein M1822_003178 [Bathelium mastoideum]
MLQLSDPVDGDNNPTVVATCKQTRFHIQGDRRSSEVSVEQLTLSILPAGGKKSNEQKARTSAKSLEILSDADLKLKGGFHYGLLGRNGSGKSTLLQAISTKTIPGLSHATRIALLQQASADYSSLARHISPTSALHNDLNKCALTYVLENNMARNGIQAELDVLSSEQINGDGGEWTQIRAYRQLQYNRMLKELTDAQKNASLRSGARGAQARKVLLALEKRVEDAKQRIDSREPPLKSEECQDEMLRASELMTDLQAELDERRLVDVEAQAATILEALGFTKTTMKMPLKELSGGWQMRCMLANVLVQDADIMILDEPTNFLDLLGIIWLQKYLISLRSSPKTVIIVSHDRDFIDNVCMEIIILKDKTLQYFDGNLTAYEEDVKSRRQNLIKVKEAQDRQIAHMEKTITANIKAGKKQKDDNKLRQAVSRQKRIEDRMGMQVNEKGHKFKLSRDHAGFQESKRKAIEIPPEEKGVRLVLPMAADLRFPGPLVSLDQVTFAYSNQQKAVLEDINLSIYMGSRVGVIGLNGSGKTTLIKLIVDGVKPTKGLADRHPRLKLGYYSQLAVEGLRAAGRANPSQTALTTLAMRVGEAMNESDMRALLGSFHLTGRTASDVPVAQLSGGQLVRLALACIVWDHPHLLVLDEVTTHLDFYTVVALARALRSFNGAILLVSHDRFLFRSVIEGDVELLGLAEGDGLDSEENTEGLRGNLYSLQSGRLRLLEHGVKDFEGSLEKKVAKLSL